MRLLFPFLRGRNLEFSDCLCLGWTFTSGLSALNGVSLSCSFLFLSFSLTRIHMSSELHVAHTSGEVNTLYVSGRYMTVHKDVQQCKEPLHA